MAERASARGSLLVYRRRGVCLAGSFPSRDPLLDVVAVVVVGVQNGHLMMGAALRIRYRQLGYQFRVDLLQVRGFVGARITPFRLWHCNAL